MLSLAVNEFIRNIKLNIVLIILLTLMTSVTIATGSVIMYEWNRYAPFYPLKGREGIFTIVMNEADKEAAGAFLDEEYVTGYSDLSPDAQEYTPVKIVCLDEWAWSAASPRLGEGSWIDKAHEGSSIAAVLGGEKAWERFRVGNELVMYDTEGMEYRFDVTGIMLPKTYCIGTANSYSAAMRNYEMFYDICYDDLFLVVRREDYEKTGQNIYTSVNKLYTYKEGHEEEKAAFFEHMQNVSGFAAIELSKWNENSRDMFFKNIRTYIPIAVVGTLLLVICTFASVYVIQAVGRRHMAVYYLLGANARTRLLLSMGNGAGIVVFSALFQTIIVNLFAIIDAGRTAVIYTDMTAAFIAGEYYTLFLLVSLLFFFLASRRMSPKEYLRRGRR